MALNQKIYFANPTKARTYGLNDVIREDGYSYSTIYTVVSTETVEITEGNFAINYLTVDACYIYVNLLINGVKFGLYQQYVGAATRGTSIFNLTDLGLSRMVLKTGDTIKVEFVYTTGTAGAPSGAIKAALLLNDYTA